MDDLQAIASEEAKKHSDDIDAAVDAAMRRLCKLPNYTDLVDNLVRSAVRHVVSDARHTMNVAMRRSNSEYGGPAKVVAGSAVNRVASDYYAYYIGGRTLGTIKGEELTDIAASESERANGHDFNARLCRSLAPLVPKDKTVRQCVKPGKLRTIFEGLNGRKGKVA